MSKQLEMNKRGWSESGVEKCKRRNVEDSITRSSSPGEDVPGFQRIPTHGLSKRFISTPPQSLNLQCKRSVSLEDLSPSLERSITLRRRLVIGFDSMAQTSEEEDESETRKKRHEHLAMKGYSAFLRNVWRKSRLEGIKKDLKIIAVSNKSASLSMQVSTLKYILASDEKVVTSWAKEIQILKSNLSQAMKDTANLRREKNSLESEIDRLEGEIAKSKTEVMNEKNTCELARSEALALEHQLEKEREKIGKLKQELLTLNSQLDSVNKECEEKDKTIKGVIFTIDELGQKVDAQETLLKQADLKIMDDTRALRETAEDLQKLNFELARQCELNNKLLSQTSVLETTLAEREKCYASLEEFCHRQTINLVEIQAHKGDNEPDGWVPVMARVVSSLVVIPLAILEAFAFPEGPLFTNHVLLS